MRKTWRRQWGAEYAGLKTGRLPFSLYLDLRCWVLGVQTLRLEHLDRPGHTRTVYLLLGPLCLSIWRTVG